VLGRERFGSGLGGRSPSQGDDCECWENQRNMPTHGIALVCAVSGLALSAWNGTGCIVDGVLTISDEYAD